MSPGAKTQALLETEAYGFRLVHRFAFGALGQGAGPRGGADLLFENVALQPERAPRTVRAAAAQGAVLRQGGDFLRGVSPALRARYQVGRVGGQATFTCLDGKEHFPQVRDSLLPSLLVSRVAPRALPHDTQGSSAAKPRGTGWARARVPSTTSIATARTAATSRAHRPVPACAARHSFTAAGSRTRRTPPRRVPHAPCPCALAMPLAQRAGRTARLSPLPGPRQAAGTDRSLFLSRVNDGICDCCDGADEWRHGVRVRRGAGRRACPAPSAGVECWHRRD